MRVTIDDDKCHGHARCYALCPEIFEIDDLGYSHADHKDVPPEFQAKARLAVDSCPERAISIEE